MLLMIDNYDSFTYNVVQYLGELGAEVRVFRNDEIDIGQIEALNPEQLVISPGPCTPNEAGISVPAIEHFAGKLPILGICLGHQSIGQAFGGRIVRARQVMHGKTSRVYHQGAGVFEGLPNPVEVTRYHSLVIEQASLPDCLEVTAWTQNEDGSLDEIMGVRHRTLDIEGVQFHPESILTEKGHELLANFLTRRRDAAQGRPTMNIQQAIAKVVDHLDLSRADMTDVMRQVMTGQCTDAQIAGFLVALRMKSESIDEITGAAQVMRELATPVKIGVGPLVDIVGTGGDGANLFNISSASAFVAAAAGAKVAKHGNRAVSSSSGSADLLEACGVDLSLSGEQVARCVEKTGVGFMFAPGHHSAMKHAIGPRRELGMRTLFNILGPMTNPAGAKRLLIGVFSEALCRPMAEVMRELGAEHVMVVHASDGLDEISLATHTKVAELWNGDIQEYSLSPEDVGIESQSLIGLEVTSSADSLRLIMAAFNNESSTEARKARAIIGLNAGAAIYLAGLASTLADGVALALAQLENGQALAKMEELAAFSQQVAQEQP